MNAHASRGRFAALSSVMAGLDPAIHVVIRKGKQDVDHRDKPGDDDG